MIDLEKVDKAFAALEADFDRQGEFLSEDQVLRTLEKIGRAHV